MVRELENVRWKYTSNIEACLRVSFVIPETPVISKNERTIIWFQHLGIVNGKYYPVIASSPSIKVESNKCMYVVIFHLLAWYAVS